MTLVPVGIAIVTLPEGLVRLLEQWPDVVRLALFLAWTLVAVVIGWYLLTPAIVEVVRRRNRNNPTIVPAITRYLRVLFVLVALVVGAAATGYTGFLGNSALLVAAGTLAIGVAAQAVIGSLVSGIVLVWDPEFNVGDYIRWDDRQGTVQSITLRVTRVVTPDGELVTVPNENLTAKAVVRPYGRGRYRVVEHLGIAYDEDVADALAILETVATEVDSISEAPSPEVYLDEFGSDAVVLRSHYWIENPAGHKLFEVRSRYAREVKRRFDEAGITLTPSSKRDLEGRLTVDIAD